MENHATLHRQLDQFASKGGRWLVQSQLRDCLMRHGKVALLLLCCVPAGALLLGLIHLWHPTWWGLAALTFMLPVAWLLVQLIAIFRHHPTRQESLAVVDERFDLKDRLQTADDFLRTPSATPFTDAALEDSAKTANHVDGKELFWEWGEWSLGSRAIWCPLLALALFVLTLFVPNRSDSFADPRAMIAATPQVMPSKIDKEPEDKQEQVAVAAKPEPNKPPVPKTTRKKPLGTPEAKPSAQASEQTNNDDDMKETEGLTEGGQHSDAKSSGRSDRSMGAPGNQSPASRQSEKPAPKKKPKKKLKKKDPPKKPKKKVEDKSGATAGRGSSSGSSRNPASSEWSSKDRTEESEDQELEEEDDVDDDESESEARGGLQPNLRDRRPPVNRDLSIGFGNRANPDANGRGGPSQRKKSRGVASLVLGVPVPDHVKGQPNPGRVKITQERIQPKAENAEPVDAEDRGERQTPYGPVPQRQLTPDLKRIVRDYFLNLRESEGTDSNT